MPNYPTPGMKEDRRRAEEVRNLPDLLDSRVLPKQADDEDENLSQYMSRRSRGGRRIKKFKAATSHQN